MLDDAFPGYHLNRNAVRTADGCSTGIRRDIIDNLPERIGVIEGEVQLVAQYLAAEFDSLFDHRPYEAEGSEQSDCSST